MQWQLVVALAIMIPLVLFPAAFVWYINLDHIYAAVRGARAKRPAQEKGAKTTA